MRFPRFVLSGLLVIALTVGLVTVLAGISPPADPVVKAVPVARHALENDRLAEAALVAGRIRADNLRADRAARDFRAHAREVRIARQKAAAAAEARREARERRAAQQVAQAPRTVTSSGSLQGYALSRVGSAQFACLKPLWDHESGWSVYATNPSSGAYGIPQSLPGSKMASAGGDWRTNGITQINWGLSYIESTYGSPCGAWSAFQSKGWY